MLIYWIESVIEVEILQIKFLYTKADDLGEKFKNETTRSRLKYCWTEPDDLRNKGYGAF